MDIVDLDHLGKRLPTWISAAANDNDPCQRKRPSWLRSV